MPREDPDRNPVEILADEFLERHRQGNAPTVEEYANDHPDLAGEILDLFPMMLSLERAKSERELSSGRRASLRGAHLERLGDFRILGEIGRGGMGIVYEAEQESLGRHVAVKVLPRQTLIDARHLARFHREAQTAAKLHHTNIVPVFGTGEQDGYHYYVMQFIRGLGLDDVLAALRGPAAPRAVAHRSGMLPADAARTLRDGRFEPGSDDAAESGQRRAPGLAYWRSVARIGHQVADALEYAHAQGTLHRDIKPANLLLDQQGVIWVTDFGLAKALENEELTQTGDVVGTLQYMAPEQLHGTFDARGDIYGLGLTLYELLTLQPAFHGRARSQLLRTIDAGQVVRPSRIDPSIPDDLETIVLKAVSRDPAHRYQSARELGEDLQRFLEDRPIRARRITALEHVWRWCRRNRAMAGLAASTIVAVLVAAASGWIGYAMTTDALEREEARSRELVAATALAEDNLDGALEAFDEIFDQIIGPDLLAAFGDNTETEEAELTVPPVSEKDAELLQHILEFYGRFAEQNAPHAHLVRETARAHRRVGQIQARLERPRDAEAAYLRALGLYEELATSQNFDASLEYEMAGTHNLLGQTLIRSRRGSGRNSRSRGERQPEEPSRREQAVDHHNSALRILEGLLAIDATNPELLLAKADTCRLFWRATRRRRDNRDQAREMIERAVSTLEFLVARHPAVEAYGYELARTTYESMFAGRRRGPQPSPTAESVERLGKAHAIAERLVAAQPDSAKYRFLLASTSRSLTPVVEAGDPRWGTTEELLRQSLELQLSLVEESPTNFQYWRPIGSLLSGLDEILRREEQIVELRTLLTNVARRLDPVSQETDPRRSERAIGTANALLADLLEELGEHEGAERARAKVAWPRRR